MNTDDEDLWTTYVTITPEDDKDWQPNGCGWGCALVAVVVLLILWLVLGTKSWH